jgi:putative ABC transport system substrate-binding protein
MRRREFITLVGGAVLAAWSLPVWAQQSAMPVVGWFNPQPIATSQEFLDGFLRGLREGGYIDGKNVKVELHTADGERNRLPALAADLVQRGITVIMAGSPPAALAAQRATKSIPIVFTSGADPVRIGLVSSYTRPGGNITGFHVQFSQLVGKRLALLLELVPQAKRIGILINPDNPSDAQATVKNASDAALALDVELKVFNARTGAEIDNAFVEIAKWRADAALVGPDPFFASRRNQFASRAAHHSIPMSVFRRSDVEAGGLISYGQRNEEMYRLAGGYVARILNGEKPADLPVQQPTAFEMAINLKTAKTLGISVPQSIMISADYVIE